MYYQFSEALPIDSHFLKRTKYVHFLYSLSWKAVVIEYSHLSIGGEYIEIKSYLKEFS